MRTGTSTAFLGSRRFPISTVPSAGYRTGEPRDWAGNRMYKAARLDAHQQFWPHGETVANRCRANSNTRETCEKATNLARHLRHSNCSVMAAGHRVSRFGSELKNTTVT